MPETPPRDRFRVGVWGAMAAVGPWLGVSLVLAGCGQDQPHVSGAPSTTAPAPATTAAPTTGWAASAPLASPASAAATLVAAWARGERATAVSVASADAVATLFAAPYPGQSLAISRGCTSAFPPIVCTYGPPGGAPPTEPIYEIVVSQTAAGWYVSSVRILG